ncbi:hypothetical protein D3C76_1590900 [compost metagenome]
MPGRCQQQDILQAHRAGPTPGQRFIEPAGNDPVGEVRVEHDVGAAVGQVEVVIEQAAVTESAGSGAWQVTHTFHDHRDRARGEQRLAQVAGVQRHKA